MIVYGDHARLVPVRPFLAEIEAGWRHAATLPTWIERHGAMVTTFLDMAGLIQGLADALFDAEGCDARWPAVESAQNVLMIMAQAVCHSWQGRENRPAALPWEDISKARLPETVNVKVAEGHAFYAVYPEAYLQAALSLCEPRPTRVMGLRSIGTGLAAIVASALDAGSPLTVRPVGHPFSRELRLSASLEHELSGDATWAIVDEGPGLSGSSFRAARTALASQGVVGERTVLMPSHHGAPGSQATRQDQGEWLASRRACITFDEMCLVENAPHPLPDWFVDCLGAPQGPLIDISGGAWRDHAPGKAETPVFPQQEQRKFLLTTQRGCWLLKFLGLGRVGLERFERARILHRAGFCAEPIAWRHGFIAERWHGEAQPWMAADRARLLTHLRSYLLGRWRMASPPGEGASAGELVEMARYNSGAALGGALADRLSAQLSGLDLLMASLPRMHTDNRLHAWEWLGLPDGRVLKGDACCHSTAHDLIGCQNVAWDVAGACLEFSLTRHETALLARGLDVNPALLDAFIICYSAFQLGLWHMAAAQSGHLERARIFAHMGRYEAMLQTMASRGAR